MKQLLMLFALLFATFAQAEPLVSIQKYGVLPTNTAEVNTQNLQAAIDKMSSCGGALFVEPVEGGYPMDGGLVLKRNVSLIGVHGPTGRGTSSVDRKNPVGSMFVIKDRERVFITVESATQIRGIQFFYPEQAFRNPAEIIAYPATIQMSHTERVEGVTLSCLTFYGEYFAMDFRAPKGRICEQILFEHCYGYPLSGRFIAIDYCYDIPRVLHCHVNPANMRLFGRSFAPAVIDAVVAQKTYTYWIDHTDNAQMMDVFTFGNYGGVYLGKETYGQLTNFNLDCVTIGIYKTGSNTKNRNWQIAQGSIIANIAEDGNPDLVHPIVIDGIGHTALANVEAFSGKNGALTTCGTSRDFLYIKGNHPLTVSMTGCRMQGYTAQDPILKENPNAKLRAVACMDKEGNFFDR